MIFVACLSFSPSVASCDSAFATSALILACSRLRVCTSIASAKYARSSFSRSFASCRRRLPRKTVVSARCRSRSATSVRRTSSSLRLSAAGIRTPL